MSIWLPPSGGIGRRQTNLSASARNGTTITGSGSIHTKGAYSAGELIASLDEDIYGLSIITSNVNQSGVATACLLDIGVGASGSERDLIQNLDCGGSRVPGATSGPRHWYFPVRVVAGERIAARLQGLIASETASVAVYGHHLGQGQEMEVPTLWSSIGADTGNSRGTSVTPASGSFGSWTTILDPITADYKWWHVGYGSGSDTTIVTGGHCIVELGIGDTSGAVTTIGSWMFASGTDEGTNGPHPSFPVYHPTNADTVNGVFARIASWETEARYVTVYAGE